MKARLVFDLDDLDDQLAHLRCTLALDMAVALLEIRGCIGEELSEDSPHPMAKTILDIFEDHRLRPEDLTR